MHAVLSRPAPPARPAPRQPEGGTDSPERISSGQAAEVFGGGVLLACGLRRGSWSGWALAAVGGFLVYRGLTRRRPSAAPWEKLARRDFLPALAEPDMASRRPSFLQEAESSRGAEWTPQLEKVTREKIATADVEGSAASPRPVSGLTSEEHEEAQVRAYFYALERGGGWLPSYDEGRAVEDFCRAAGEVLAQRTEGRAN